MEMVTGCVLVQIDSVDMTVLWELILSIFMDILILHNVDIGIFF